MKALLLWLFVAISVVQASAQTRTISGKVTDARDGTPLPGVTVAIKGTAKGTTTDVSGVFKLEAAPGATIVFSYVGFLPHEAVVGTATSIDASLNPDNRQLSEVVVTALGISREKKALGYNVQNLKGDELVRSNEPNAIQTLASKVAGVQVIGSGGTPGASSKIIIRGNSTFTGNNQPLIVVDGVPIDNGTNATVSRTYPYTPELQGVNNSNRALDINPNDIESVTVLKGPAAAALYGTRAGNGAIIYTTKRGKAGALSVVYDFNAEISKVSQLPKEQNKYAQGRIVSGVPTFMNGQVVESWGPAISSISGARAYDNTKEFFETGTGFNHNLSVTGGKENISYRFSFGRYDQKGIIPTTDLARTTARLNLDAKLTDKLSLGVSTGYSNTEGTKAQNGSNLAGTMLALMRAPVSWNLADYRNPDDGTSRNYLGGYDNPYWSLHENPFKDKIDRILGNARVAYDILPWLSASYKLGLDYYSDFRKQVFAITSKQVDNQLGQIEEYEILHKELYSDLLLSANKKLSEQFHLTANVGGNLTQTSDKLLLAQGNNLSVPGFYNLNNASVLYTDEETRFRRSSALFYDFNLSFRNMLFLGTTGRNEWSSTFGRTKKDFFYPSVTLAFVFTDIIPQNKILSYGKLRAAFAQGGLSPDPYTSMTNYVAPFFADGMTDGNRFPFLGRTGFIYNSLLGNENLRPEKATEKEIGLDLKLWDSRINLEVTLYDKKSEDLLVKRPTATSSGAKSQWVNAGSMTNKGIEILASADVIKLKDLTWNVALNFTRNRNKVLSLADGVDEIDVEEAFTQIGSFAIVGQPYGALYSTKWKRAPDGQMLINGTTGLPIVDDERGNIGNPFPDWTGGARSTLTYKGITFGFLIDVREGGMLWNGTIARMHRYGRTKESEDRERTYIVPGVVKTTDDKYVPNTTPISALSYFTNVKGDGPAAATENAVFDGSWVRLREVTLGYRYNFRNSRFLKYADLTLSGRNLWLKTDYPGVDPETSLTGAGSNLNGFDYFNNPATKSYAVGVRVGF